MLEAFGPYLLLRVLGRGGMGIVYVARSRLPDHPVVALKKLRADAAQVPTFRERFEHECKLALQLQHPRIVRVLDAGRVNGVPYIASELVLGHDVGAIASRLQLQGLVPPIDVAVRIIVDMLAGLDYVHEARTLEGRPLSLVHRDVTPTNVLVGYDGVSRLADFGLAKSLVTDQLQLTTSGMIIGTPKFMAPEVARGQPADQRSDLYSLGAVAYRLLAGKGPFEGDDIRQILDSLFRQTPVPLNEVHPELPPWCIEHIHNWMAHLPSDRPSSAREAGLRFVADAQQDGAIVPRQCVCQWLQNLFDDEYTEQFDAYRRDSAVDLNAVPPDRVTMALRLLAAKPSIRRGDHTACRSSSPEDGYTEPGTLARAREAERTVVPTAFHEATQPERLPAPTENTRSAPAHSFDEPTLKWSPSGAQTTASMNVARPTSNAARLAFGRNPGPRWPLVGLGIVAALSCGTIGYYLGRASPGPNLRVIEGPDSPNLEDRPTVVATPTRASLGTTFR